MLVLGVCSLKGGVGKTSVTLGLASSALHRGLRTLVVDLDPQGDSTLSLAPAPTSGNVAEVLDSPGLDTLTTATSASSWADEGLDVVVGSPDAVRHDGYDGSVQELDRLRFALAWLRGYDLVLVDCPPSLGGLTRTGLAACDRAVVVAEPGLFAVTAVGRAMRTIDELRRGPAAQLQPLGVVINRVRSQSSEHGFRMEELRGLYGPLVLNPIVPERAALQQAQGAAQPVHRWPGQGARDLSWVFDQLLDRALRAPRG